jgi:hypothetical protein
MGLDPGGIFPPLHTWNPWQVEPVASRFYVRQTVYISGSAYSIKKREFCKGGSEI